MTIPPFEWSPTADDLEDDAVCVWQDMMLRYEQMSEACWWWCVYAISGDEIASSNDLPGSPGGTHHAARLLAEGAAIREWVRRMA